MQHRRLPGKRLRAGQADNRLIDLLGILTIRCLSVTLFEQQGQVPGETIVQSRLERQLGGRNNQVALCCDAFLVKIVRLGLDHTMYFQELVEGASAVLLVLFFKKLNTLLQVFNFALGIRMNGQCRCGKGCYKTKTKYNNF